MKNKIVILTGMSACGKDTIAKKLVGNHFYRVITNTTRPPRKGEVDGIDYHFLNETQFFDIINNGDMIEYRKYNTEFGIWYYGSSVNNNNIDLTKHDYVAILTLDAIPKYIDFFGKENCIVFYIDCPKSIREKRANERGSFNKEEWDRRVAADKIDFANDKIIKLCDFKINNYNRSLRTVVEEILKDVKMWKNG